MSLTRINSCAVCGREIITENSLLAPGWVVLWDYPFVICPVDLDNYEKRFGEKPVIYSEGGVEEPNLFGPDFYKYDY